MWVGLYKDIAFPQCKEAFGKLIFLSYQFSSFYINPPHAYPSNTQVLSDFRVSGKGCRESLASSGLDPPPAQVECQILMEDLLF